MSENRTELAKRLVIGRKRDGRCRYDAQAKAEIVQMCLRRGASVSRIAMQYGINANLVRAWISKAQPEVGTRSGVRVNGAIGEASFVALPIQMPEPQRVASQVAMVRVQVRLPNGVAFDVSETRIEALSALIDVLSALACSNSTHR